jgi:sirohydrochlorin cobaltochelatase
MDANWKDAGLLLVGHGSSRRTGAGDATRRLAESLCARHLFADVKACFWREEPTASLDLLAQRRIYVIPNFSGHGSHTDHLIPALLGLSGPRTEIGGRVVYYGKPVGSHPSVPALISRRAADWCARQGLAPAATTLLLVAHGSRNPMASHTPEAIAAAVRRESVFAEVLTAYLEQEPSVRRWPDLVATDRIIALPLLLSEGMHVNIDLPPLFDDPALVGERQVWLINGIGRDSDVESMILDQVRAIDDGARP